MPLRDYQNESIEVTCDEWVAGIMEQLIVAPTASGKTIIFANMRKRFIERGLMTDLDQMLVLVHRDKLVKQSYQKFVDYNPDLMISIEQADDRADPDSDIVIGSIQSLSRDTRLKRWDPQRFRIVIVDEAHHAIGPSYLKALEYFKVFKGAGNRDKTKLLLGYTATPKRGDSIGLEKVFSKITWQRNIREMVEAKWLTEPHAYRINTITDISEVGTAHGDFKEGQLSDTVNTFDRNRLIVEKYKELGEDMTFVAFTVDIKHSHDLADVFRGFGVPCEPISGDTPDAKRADLYRRHDSGELRGLTSCGVLSEGWDNPRCSVACMARPTKSSLLYIQQLGRVLRPFPSPEDEAKIRAAGQVPEWIKRKAIILDFADQTGRHQVITIPTLFGLRAEFDAAGEGMVKTKKKVDEFIRNNPGIFIEQATSLEQIRAMVTKVDLLGPPMLRANVKQYSKYAWLHDKLANTYRIGLNTGEVLTIGENGLGQWDVYKNFAGTTTKLATSSNIADAFWHADSKVPQQSIGILLANARWRKDEPSEGQCKKLFWMDKLLRQNFRNTDAFHKWVTHQYERGNMDWSKGGLADKIDSLTTTVK